MSKNIKVLWDEVVHKWDYLILQNRKFEQGGKIHKYEMVTRNNVDKIITCLPVTSDNKIILTKEYRIPLKNYTIGIPAWLGDKPWEDGKDIVKRELKEETWYESDDIRYSFTTGTSEGMTDEKIDCYLALNCKKVSDTLDLDESEVIEVIEVSISEIDDFITRQITNGMTVWSKFLALLYMYKNRNK